MVPPSLAPTKVGPQTTARDVRMSLVQWSRDYAAPFPCHLRDFRWVLTKKRLNHPSSNLYVRQNCLSITCCLCKVFAVKSVGEAHQVHYQLIDLAPHCGTSRFPQSQSVLFRRGTVAVEAMALDLPPDVDSFAASHTADSESIWWVWIKTQWHSEAGLRYCSESITWCISNTIKHRNISKYLRIHVMNRNRSIGKYAIHRTVLKETWASLELQNKFWHVLFVICQNIHLLQYFYLTWRGRPSGQEKPYGGFHKWGFPIAGWFLLGKIPLTWRMTGGYFHFRKPPFRESIKLRVDKQKRAMNQTIQWGCSPLLTYNQSLHIYWKPSKRAVFKIICAPLC